MRRKQIAKLIQALHSWEDSLKHLGECVVQFQRIEDCLSICIGRFIGRNRLVGDIVTAEMSYRAKVSVFSALFQQKLNTASLPSDVTELVGRLHWAEEQRNTLVHSLWDATEANPNSVRREKKAIRKKMFSISAEHHTPEELEDLNRVFEGIITDIIFLTGEHFPNMRPIYPRRQKKKGTSGPHLDLTTNAGAPSSRQSHRR
jgi:hypothetical protein